MSSPAVDAFVFDEENEGKLASHGLSSEQVEQILDSDPLAVKNRKQGRAEYLLIGRDHGGKYISVPIERTMEEGVWRPVTAWPSKPSEIVKARQGGVR